MHTVDAGYSFTSTRVVLFVIFRYGIFRFSSKRITGRGVDKRDIIKGSRFLLYKRKDKLTDVESQIKIIKNFAAKVLRHIRYIANHAKYKITTGIIEGINNKIKNIKRRAYGIKDLQYLKLLAIDAFY